MPGLLSFTSGTLGIVVGLMLWVPPAGAATVTSTWAAYQLGSGIEVKAAPGEQNRLTVRFAGDMAIVHDPAGLQPTPSCFADDPQTVRCPISGEGLNVQVLLGDGDDTFDMPRTGATVLVDGGAGNDAITVDGDFSRGGELAHLLGGPGDDRLSGEWVMGGPGNDVLKADLHFDYSDHTSGVDVDLARGTATSAEGADQLVLTPWKGWYVNVTTGPGPDRIHAAPGRRLVAEAGPGDDVIEGGTDPDLLRGGPGADVLRGGGNGDDLAGGEGDDRLEGGSVRDLLDGGPGNDVLIGRGGHDALSGGDGADRIDARDGARDQVDCAGNRMDPGDRVVADTRDDVRACHDVRRPAPRALEVQAIVRSTRTSQVLQVWCPPTARRAACSGRIGLDRVRKGWVSRTVRVAPGRTARLRFAIERQPGYWYRFTIRGGPTRGGFARQVES